MKWLNVNHVVVELGQKRQRLLMYDSNSEIQLTTCAFSPVKSLLSVVLRLLPKSIKSETPFHTMHSPPLFPSFVNSSVFHWRGVRRAGSTVLLQHERCSSAAFNGSSWSLEHKLDVSLIPPQVDTLSFCQLLGASSLSRQSGVLLVTRTYRPLSLSHFGSRFTFLRGLDTHVLQEVFVAQYFLHLC